MNVSNHYWTISMDFTGLFVDAVALHDLHGARGLLQLYAVQVVYADGGQRLLLVLLLLLLLHSDGQFGLGPVQRRRLHVNRPAVFVWIAGAASDALQILRRFDESVVMGARGRKLWRNERRLLLLLSDRCRCRPTADADTVCRVS